MRHAVILCVIFYCGCANLGQVAGRELNPKVSPHEACQNGNMLACNQSISDGLAFFKKGCDAGDKVKCNEYQGYVTDSKAERSPQVIDQHMFNRMSQPAQ